MDIEITLKNYRCFEDSHPARFIIRSAFTGFVGPNNSGKSSILRFFYEFRDLFELMSKQMPQLRNAFRNNPHQMQMRGVLDIGEVFCKKNNRPIELEFKIHDPAFSEGSNATKLPSRIIAKFPRGTDTFTLHVEVDNKIFDSAGANIEGTVLRAGEGQVDLYSYMEAFGLLAKSIYIPAFRNIINTGSNDSYYDIKVGQAFVQNWRTLKTGNDRRKNEAAAEVTKVIRNIFDFENLDINASEDSQSLIIMIDEKAYGLHEQGAGFTQFVLGLINAAIEQPSFVLIDEPELGLHASLQMEFLTSLGSLAQEGVLFATHSIGLARSAGELVYSLRKNEDGNGEINELGNEPRLAEMLGELNFSGYRELGFDGILLVEGSTDIKWMHELLRKYGKDRKFVVFSLGGANLIRGGVVAVLEEIKRITDNIYALIDSEKSAAGEPLDQKHQEFVGICETLGIQCHVLERRATENYLSETAIQRFFSDKYRALGQYELLSDLEFGWAKSDNWKIVRLMDKQEIDASDLGTFLESI